MTNDILTKKDIQPHCLFTYFNYKVHCNIRYFQGKIDEWIEQDNLELNPWFQRGHVWQEEHQVAFIEYLMLEGETPPIVFNHPGWMGSHKGQMVCVDGLQRITAMKKFMDGEIAPFGYFVDKIDLPILRSMDFEYAVTTFESERDIVKLYRDINWAGEPHSEEEYQRITKALVDLEKSS